MRSFILRRVRLLCLTWLSRVALPLVPARRGHRTGEHRWTKEPHPRSSSSSSRRAMHEIDAAAYAGGRTLPNCPNDATQCRSTFWLQSRAAQAQHPGHVSGIASSKTGEHDCACQPHTHAHTQNTKRKSHAKRGRRPKSIQSKALTSEIKGRRNRKRQQLIQKKLKRRRKHSQQETMNS